MIEPSIQSYAQGKGRSKEEAGEARKTETESMGSLIPGLPDDLVARHVVPGVSWWDFASARAVSKAWRSALNARKRFRRNDSTVPPPLQSPPIPCSSCGFAVCGMREVLFVMGGQDEASGRVLGDVHMMDLSSSSGGVWKRCPSMRWPRMSFGCVVAAGKIVVAGGQSEESAALGTAEMYDPDRECWESLPNLNMPTSSCIAALTDERIVLLGGLFSSDGEFWVESAQAVGYGDHAWRTIKDEDLPNILKECTPFPPPGLLHPLHLNVGLLRDALQKGQVASSAALSLIS